MNVWAVLILLHGIVGTLAGVWIGYRLALKEPVIPKRKDPAPNPEMIFKDEEVEAALEETTSPSIDALTERYNQTVGKAIDHGIHGLE